MEVLETLGNAASTAAASHPLVSTGLVLWLLWAAASWAIKGKGVKMTSSGSGSGEATREEQLARARERQQKMLELAAEARQQPAPQSTRPSDASAGGSAAPPAPAAAPRVDASAKESYTQRLARLEKGKGPSDSNPLVPQSNASSAKPVCRKRGGG